MSDWRSNSRGAQRGGERGNWRARGQGSRGRGVQPGGSSSGPAATTPAIMVQPNRSDPVTARRRMNLMASVSRSSGLEKDGDDLKNWKTQEEYRNFIQEKLDDVMATHRNRTSETEKEKKLRMENQGNVLILFRKLREGVASSSRNDGFAMEVYETSLYLSIIYESPKQTTSVIPHLFQSEPISRHASPSSVQTPSMHSVLSSLFHHLVASYPSQGHYHQHLASISKVLLPRTSEIGVWLASMTKSLRTRNYAKFASLSQKSTIIHVIDTYKNSALDLSPVKSSSAQTADPQLALDAVLLLLDALRQKVAETAWSVIRSAYREVSTDPSVGETKNWLARSLYLDSVYADDQNIEVEDWLSSKVSVGYVRKKEGVDARWIVCKAR